MAPPTTQAKEQMLLLEGYMLQMEREVDRYKVESQRLKDESDALRTQLAAKHSSLEYSKTASGRQGKQAEDVSRQSEVVAQLQGQLIILKDSFDAVSKGIPISILIFFRSFSIQ